ncbi:calcium release-activated calcium channel protein 1 isoform X2 [Agrilus planipennis]|uniref:Calcium release-activated calcium channel protein 1 isoform X2 n=1 Tax=Agrilus planipennis TaxID=224129 RepID=A0A1W4XLM7_AGRPL|nr:calcium release-activated calcium channel protein 1 isoform X2 [Agrilus planipennis]
MLQKKHSFMYMLGPLTKQSKSLNFSTETIQKGKPSFRSDSPQARIPQNGSEITLSVPYLDIIPSSPVSSHSSTTIPIPTPHHKTYTNGYRSPAGRPGFLQVPPPYHSQSSDISTEGSVRSCKCFKEVDSEGKISMSPAVTPEGLSWRRLHMSRAKLKATSTTSELLSGFAMVAMVELQIDEDTQVPEWLFVMFSVCTTVLVAVHIFALMISTYILPNIDAISKLDICELVSESPHERMKGFIELAWVFSTVLGLFLFLVEISILCWVKFWDHSKAAIAATVIVIPVLIMFVLFAIHFYHSLVVHRCDTSLSDMQKLEDMKKQLDAVAPV